MEEKQKKKKGCLSKILMVFGVLFILSVLGVLTSGGDDETSGTTTTTSETANDSQKTVGESNDSQTEEEPEEVVIEIEADVDTMVDELNDNALRAEKTYQDKVILLTGKFASADSDGKYFSLSPIHDEWSFDRIQIDIEQDIQVAQVMNLEDGDTVSVIVRIDHIGEVMGYSGNCIEILDVPSTAIDVIASSEGNYYQLDCSTLVAELESNALKAEQKYQDVYVEVSGLLSNIDSDGDYFSLEPSNGDFTMTSVMCYIDESMIDTLINYNMGDKMVVRGKVSSIGEVIGYHIDVIEILE